MKPCQLTNTEVLCFVLGWQGDTLADLAKTLEVPAETILNADRTAMQNLCRRAQLRRSFTQVTGF